MPILTTGALNPTSEAAGPPLPRLDFFSVEGRGYLASSTGGLRQSVPLSPGIHRYDRSPFTSEMGLTRSANVANALSTSEGEVEVRARLMDLYSTGVRIAPASTVRPEDSVAYITTIRSLLERGDIGSARRVLEAVPVRFSEESAVRRLRAALAPPRVTTAPKQDIDRTKEYEWLKLNKTKYGGQWVALLGDELVASAKSYRELRERLASLRLGYRPLIQHLG
jgi:hypothetical protein